MSRLIELLDVSELPEGSAREVTAAGRVFAVYNVDGVLYALDGVCPHAGGPLGKGMLRDGVVTCPWHGWQFDVTTGRHCLNDQLCQPQFPVEIHNQRICVRLPDPTTET